MKKIDLNVLALQDSLKEHKQIKSKLVSLIDTTNSHKEYNKDNYYGDSVNRLDWNYSVNFDREWVKFVRPYLQKKFDKFATRLNYQSAEIKCIWFQQYIQNDYHGWHKHSDNYTGVYYLELPKNSPKTELIDQKDIHKKITINAKEGDIVVFPSFIIHRAPKVKSNVRKTIISFNINMNLIKSSIFSTINSL